ncbi:MAG: carboxypeptidase-like regulatory domain-containing protein [Candidatus Eisenbacteria bacterium]
MAGLIIDLFDGNGYLVADTVTDGNGQFVFADIPLGDYEISIVAPVGYEAMAPIPITVAAKETYSSALHCLFANLEARSMGFWKHNVAKHLKGQPNGTQVTLEELLTYADAIYNRFYLFEQNTIDIEGVTYIDVDGS